MSEASYFWPTADGQFVVEYRMGDNSIEGWPFELRNGVWVDDVTRKGWTQDDMMANGYLGVRREPATLTPTPKTITPDPDDGNAMVAQKALDEWRACKQQPKAADWAYRWAVDLCERLGAR